MNAPYRRVGTWIAGFFDFLRPKSSKFFKIFAEQAETAVRAWEVLSCFVEGKEQDVAAKMVALEVEGDDARRKLVRELYRTYLTPFDREDIFSLSRAIDDIIDATEACALELATYGVAPNEYLRQMVELLGEAIHAIRSSLEDLSCRPEAIPAKTLKAKRAISSLQNLSRYGRYQAIEKDDPKESLKWLEVYRSFQQCGHQVEVAADILSDITVKYTQ